MKATELRIGNWVLIPQSDEIIIPVFPKQVKGIGIFGGIDFTEPQYPENHIVHAIHCAGISLAEEWLLKFGFEYTEAGWIDKKLNSIYIIERGNGCVLYKSHAGAIAEVKHVHQLQNLYFALIGEELEIK